MTSTDKTKEKKLTVKQKMFADKYIENKGNGTKSALEVYDTTDPHVAGSIADENLKKPVIRAYLDDKGDMAGSIIEELATTSEKEDIRLNASKFIYEQVHGKATQKVEAKLDGELSINIVRYSGDE